MNIGIIVHSHTGNTLSVANKIKEELEKKGHTVNVERIKAENENPNAVTEIKLKQIPQINGYDYIIFGAMVRGFCLSPVMKKYLEQIDSLSEKTVGCYLTQQFPFAFLGGNRSIRQMKNLIKLKGNIVKLSGVINWSNKKREEQIHNLVALFDI